MMINYLKSIHYKDLLAILSRVAGLSILITDATFVNSVNSLFGKDGAGILAAIGFVTTLAADLLRISGSPSGDFVSVKVVPQKLNNLVSSTSQTATINAADSSTSSQGITQ